LLGFLLDFGKVFLYEILIMLEFIQELEGYKHVFGGLLRLGVLLISFSGSPICKFSKCLLAI